MAKVLLLVLALAGVLGCSSQQIKPLGDSATFGCYRNRELGGIELKVVKINLTYRYPLTFDNLFKDPDDAGGNSMAPVPFPSSNPTTMPLYITRSRSVSGVVIKESSKSSYILTAGHMLVGIKEEYIHRITVSCVDRDQRLSDDRLIDGASIVYLNRVADICVLKTRCIGNGVIEINTGTYPSVLADILLIGYPGGYGMVINRSTVTSYYESDIDHPGKNFMRIRFSGPIEPGDSGGAILDKDHRLIGIMLGKITSNDGSGITGFDISKLLRDIPMP